MSQRAKKKDEGGGKGIVGAAKELLKKDLEKRRRFLPAGKNHSKCSNDLYYRSYPIFRLQSCYLYSNRVNNRAAPKKMCTFQIQKSKFAWLWVL